MRPISRCKSQADLLTQENLFCRFALNSKIQILVKKNCFFAALMPRVSPDSCLPCGGGDNWSSTCGPGPASSRITWGLSGMQTLPFHSRPGGEAQRSLLPSSPGNPGTD